MARCRTFGDELSISGDGKVSGLPVAPAEQIGEFVDRPLYGDARGLARRLTVRRPGL